MSLPLISLLLLLQPLPTVCEMTHVNCLEYLKPNVYKGGGLVLGGFFPLYTMVEEEALLQIHFLTRPTQVVKDSREVAGHMYE